MGRPCYYCGESFCACKPPSIVDIMNDAQAKPMPDSGNAPTLDWDLSKPIDTSSPAFLEYKRAMEQSPRFQAKLRLLREMHDKNREEPK